MISQKIAVIGNAGSGKTTLALALHQKLKLPLYHLDQYYWLPNWQRRCYETFTEVHDALCAQNAWIIEGCNLRLIRTRLESADIIIFLDIPRFTCLTRIIKRAIDGYGIVLLGNPARCHQEIFSWNFLTFLRWVWSFNHRHRLGLYEILAEFKSSKKIYILKSTSDVNKFLEGIW